MAKYQAVAEWLALWRINRKVRPDWFGSVTCPSFPLCFHCSRGSLDESLRSHQNCCHLGMYFLHHHTQSSWRARITLCDPSVTHLA